MAGTKEGNQKTRDKLLAKDPDYYRKLGALGGKNSTKRGFDDPEVARRAAIKSNEVRRQRKNVS